MLARPGPLRGWPRLVLAASAAELVAVALSLWLRPATARGLPTTTQDAYPFLAATWPPLFLGTGVVLALLVAAGHRRWLPPVLAVAAGGHGSYALAAAGAAYVNSTGWTATAAFGLLAVYYAATAFCVRWGIV